MLLLSYFGHAYVWGEVEPPHHIPKNIAVPWYRVAQRLGRPPILSYASYALNNWRRIEPEGPVSLGNIVLLQNFLGGIDEEWFILVHVDIEARAAQVLRAIVSAQSAVLEDHVGQLDQQLLSLAAGVEQMYKVLVRMPENCDPYIYYHRVRPYIHGWKDHPAIPGGLVYEGVKPFEGKLQQFRGETGAQSSIIPSLDAALGILHADDPLRPYLKEMRDYMPPKQRAFIEAVENGPSIRQYVQNNLRHHPSLRKSYNECVGWIERFRSKHLEYAALYVQKQSMRSPYNPTERGTGGTPFIPYLKKHRDETTRHLL
jgi:indoleamine 2,3-dioxygenase